MIRKLKLVKERGRPVKRRLYRCPVVVLTLADGQTVKRGCGCVGMAEIDGGLRCLVCGNYRYQSRPSVESMWFHFRWAREYWRTHHLGGHDFVNGMPVAGRGDPLPPACLSDLGESHPPGWFPRFMTCGEQEFETYMSNRKSG